MCSNGAVFQQCGDFNQMQEAFFWMNNWRGMYNRARCDQWGLDSFRENPYYGDDFCVPKGQSSYNKAWAPQCGATGPRSYDNVMVQDPPLKQNVKQACGCPCNQQSPTLLENVGKFSTHAANSMNLNNWIFILIALAFGIIIGCMLKR